jgi:hypothetical protein
MGIIRPVLLQKEWRYLDPYFLSVNQISTKYRLCNKSPRSHSKFNFCWRRYVLWYLRAVVVVTEKPSATAMAGAQTTINNQLKAAAVTAMETATMTVMTMTMKRKAMAAAAAEAA